MDLGHPKPSGIRSIAQPGACPTPHPSLLPGGFPLGTSPGALCPCSVGTVGASWHSLSLPAGTTPEPPAQWVPWAGDSRGLMLLESTAGIRIAPPGELGLHPQGPRAAGPQSRLRLPLVFGQKVQVWCQHFPAQATSPSPQCLGTVCAGEGPILSQSSTAQQGQSPAGAGHSREVEESSSHSMGPGSGAAASAGPGSGAAPWAQDAQGTVLGSLRGCREQWAVPRAGGLRSAWAGPSEQGSGEGAGVSIGAGWEAQAVLAAALQSPAWLCQPTGSDRVKWRLQSPSSHGINSTSFSFRASKQLFKALAAFHYSYIFP